MVIFGSVRIMESVGSTPKTKVSLISMQVTDCKAMNSAKELALHTIKANLFLEEQTVSPILIQQK